MNCLVCGAEVGAITFGADNLGKFDCLACGFYKTKQELAEDKLDQKAAPAKERYLLQAWIRHQNLHSAEPPELTDKRCQEVITSSPRYTPSEKADQLLLAIGTICKRPGGTANVDTEFDFPLAYAVDKREFSSYFAWLLKDHEWIFGPSQAIALSRAGWDRYSALQKSDPRTGRNAFVAMWFDDSMDEAWHAGLSAGIRDAGYEPQRLKEEVHDERIDARIIASIRASRFVIADVTGGRTAVYYEAGFADGLGKPVIWTCRSDSQQHMSFDTRQFRHIIWNSPEDLRTQLAATIKARAL